MSKTVVESSQRPRTVQGATQSAKSQFQTQLKRHRAELYEALPQELRSRYAPSQAKMFGDFTGGRQQLRQTAGSCCRSAMFSAAGLAFQEARGVQARRGSHSPPCTAVAKFPTHHLAPHPLAPAVAATVGRGSDRASAGGEAVGRCAFAEPGKSL